jgi:hypothetical protein
MAEMNDYRPYNAYRYNDREYSYRNRQQSGIPLWDDLLNLAQQRPGLVLAGALFGGFLLARYWSSNDQASHYRGEDAGYRPMWTYAPERQERPRPADHMGATEDQMSNRFADPSRHELQEGSMGTTGSAYEMDPDSITAG